MSPDATARHGSHAAAIMTLRSQHAHHTPRTAYGQLTAAAPLLYHPGCAGSLGRAARPGGADMPRRGGVRLISPGGDAACRSRLRFQINRHSYDRKNRRSKPGSDVCLVEPPLLNTFQKAARRLPVCHDLTAMMVRVALSIGADRTRGGGEPSPPPP